MRKLNLTAIENELMRLQENSVDRILTAETTVNAARDADSPLHDAFEWDDEKAGELYRLEQARVLLRHFKIVITGEKPQIIPVRLSLLSDRSRIGGGYRLTQDILGSPILRNDLMKTALAEINGWMKRFAVLKSLVNAVDVAIGPFKNSQDEEIRQTGS